jgi:hypothetical protein
MEIDFITAFGRLLRDGKLRDTFAANPQAAAKEIRLRRSDLPAWLQLVSDDVEFQATVLLRKRLDMVKYFAPETCCRPGEELWPIFEKYARAYWPPEGRPKFFDAYQFCRHLKKQSPKIIVSTEWNRLNFSLAKQGIAVHWVKLPATKNKTRRGFQLFIRGPGRRFREFFFYLGW